MLKLVFGIFIFLLFVIRPFVYKKSAKVLSANTATIFTAFWSVIVSILSLPVLLKITSINFSINFGIIASILKGFCIYQIIKNTQILNKESTSASVAWGPIALAISATFNFIFLGEILTIKQFFIIFLLFVVGFSYFFICEYKSLSNKARIAFLITLIVVIINIISDRIALINISWYIHLLTCYISMILFSLCFGIKKEDIISCIKLKNTWIAGIIYALGEIVVIMAMQAVFNNVSICIFLIRVAQAFDLILAYHIYKEGKIGFQYIFAILQIIVVYFFFF